MGRSRNGGRRTEIFDTVDVGTIYFRTTSVGSVAIERIFSDRSLSDRPLMRRPMSGRTMSGRCRGSCRRDERCRNGGRREYRYQESLLRDDRCQGDGGGRFQLISGSMAGAQYTSISSKNTTFILFNVI